MIKLGAQLQHINRLALVLAVSFVTVCIVISSFVLGLFALIDTSRVQAKCWQTTRRRHWFSRTSNRQPRCCSRCAIRPT